MGRKRTLEVSLRIFENFNFFRNFEAKSIFQPGRMLPISPISVNELYFQKSLNNEQKLTYITIEIHSLKGLCKNYYFRFTVKR